MAGVVDLPERAIAILLFCSGASKSACETVNTTPPCASQRVCQVQVAYSGPVGQTYDVDLGGAHALAAIVVVVVVVDCGTRVAEKLLGPLLQFTAVSDSFGSFCFHASA